MCSNVGLQMQVFAIGWIIVLLATRDGGSALASLYLGFRSVAMVGPALAMGLIGGPLADRVDRGRVLMAARIASAIVSTLLTILDLTGAISIGAVMILSACLAATFAVDMPARHAIVPSIVHRDDLISGVSILRSGQQVAASLGPVFAGLLTAALSPSAALFCSAVLQLAALLLMLPIGTHPGGSAASQSVVAAAGDGFRYAWRAPEIRWLLILYVALAAGCEPLKSLLPALAVSGLGGGVAELSFLATGMGMGALAGTVTTGMLGRMRRPGLLTVAPSVVAGVLMCALAVQSALELAVLIAVLYGFTLQVVYTTGTIALQFATAEEFRGRVLGLQVLTFQTITPIGTLGFGAFATIVGIGPALFIGGLVTAVAAAVLLASLPSFRASRPAEA